MGKRATIADVAAWAKLSVATVDRALNGRHAVRPETLRRIYEAANAIGYHGRALIEQRLRQDLPEYRLGMLVLGHAHGRFFEGLGRRFEEAVTKHPGLRGSVRIAYLDWRDPNRAAGQIRALSDHVQALAVVSMDHPTITAAVADIRARGVPVLTLLSDFAQEVRDAYVGLNNRKAGRTAAWMINKAARRPGKVAMLVGSSRFHGHEMREIGFRTFFRERAVDFDVIDTLVNPGAADLAYEATRALLCRHPDLVGINLAGFGPEGVVEALREADTAGRVVAICNEDTPESRAALADDVITLVINTPLDRLCSELVSLMVRRIENSAAPWQSQLFVPFELLLSENI